MVGLLACGVAFVIRGSWIGIPIAMAALFVLQQMME